MEKRSRMEDFKFSEETTPDPSLQYRAWEEEKNGNRY
eukprot:CAMPEP_0170499238 /NCGR_PEP_ID=MMETSP0208-20121228/30667_1 /TAXON_ID=197538 /ORGANISM="Strombidium inclinatum, Strain S3" /LENGTH=36 /DNA_ID= /DNA_START= /DNA_END= /DNA_ORIENTATION=